MSDLTKEFSLFLLLRHSHPCQDYCALLRLLPQDDYTAFNYLDVFVPIFHPDAFGSVSNLSSSDTFNTQHWLFSFDVGSIQANDPTKDPSAGTNDDLLIRCTVES